MSQSEYLQLFFVIMGIFGIIVYVIAKNSIKK